SATYYAKIVREKATLRGLIHAGTEISRLGFESEADVDSALDRSEQLVYRLGSHQLSGEFTPIKSLMKPAFEQIDRLFRQRGDRTGVTTGFSDIDQMTTGLHPGNLVIIAARPGFGKTSLALNMAVATAKEDALPVAVFSLEMTNDELMQRLICAEANLNSLNIRKGNIKDRDWVTMSDAMGRLNELPIYLDDQGSITVSEIRSRCRRLKSLHGLGIVFIDYLQLLRPAPNNRSMNRNEELSEICRVLKATAKDLQVPIVALAQLNRSLEARQDKRPMLSDLRDCLDAGALVLNADTGERVSVLDVVDKKLRFNVWASDERLKLVRRPIMEAWEVGERDVFHVRTRSGREIKCTDGHRFLTMSGWRKLSELGGSDQIAVPRKYDDPRWRSEEMSAGKALLLGWLIGDGHLGGSAALTVGSREEAADAAALAQQEFGLRPIIKPERVGTTALRVVMTTGRQCGAGKNPLTTWLRGIGLWKCTGADKHAPSAIFSQSNEVVAAFLRGLFHADGSLSSHGNSARATVRLSTISERLARDVQHLLLRFGINAFIMADRRNIGGFRTKTTCLWTVWIGERSAVSHFLDRVGFLGKKHAAAVAKFVPEKGSDAARFDRIPLLANARVTMLRKQYGFSHAVLGWRDQGKAMSRVTCGTVAEKLDDEELAILAHSDVVWDEVASVEAIGKRTVYDITVGDLHNFCVNDVLTHNSGAIEQEADLVAFLYRDGYYNPDAAEADLTELILAKQRNGPTGLVKLRFRAENTK
ncbi:MAG: replicative DNA helicase, partial [Candidatus Eremiobacteraeota bacterium]|nr:replicative DNA helicase [Candidatus Eremiobacteraeota bacterium]